MGTVVLVLGILVFALSALADEIGVGDGSGIGWKQVVGMVVGLAAIVVGALWWRAGRGPSAAGSPAD